MSRQGPDSAGAYGFPNNFPNGNATRCARKLKASLSGRWHNVSIEVASVRVAVDRFHGLSEPRNEHKCPFGPLCVANVSRKLVIMDITELLQIAQTPADLANLSDTELNAALELIASGGESYTDAAFAVLSESRSRTPNGRPRPAATPAPVAASSAPVTNRAVRMAQTQDAAATPSRSAPHDGGMVSVIATGAGRGGRSGEVLDRDSLARLMADTLGSMPRNGPPRGEVVLARADWRDRYPDERRLGPDAFSNGIKLARIADSRDLPAALTASGGICAPVNIDWSVDVFAVADTPLNLGLPAFQADRGGLTFVPPPDIGSLASATEVWTEAMDAGAPGNGLTKPVLSIACGSPTTVYVDAVPTRLQFGNLGGRFAPEWVSANVELSIAAASRIRELNTLSHIDASSKLLNTYSLLGSARDLLATVDQAVAYYRDVHRLSDDAGLTAVFPRWAKDAFRADIARELAHDIDDTNPFAVPDSQINAWFAARSITVIWMLDGRAAKTTGSTLYQYPAETYTSVATLNPIPPWINKTVWNLFVDGTFQRLDSGTLDIGVVRDSTLDATNDYEIFSEVFEGVAFRGVEALTLISPVLPNGASAGTIATSSYTGA